MLLPPSTNLFIDDCIHELDLHRLREFLYENTGTCTNVLPVQQESRTTLMDIIMKNEGEEQDLKPFDPNFLKPLQALPPGKLPGINFDPSAASLPTSIFSLSSSSTSAAVSGSPGNSPKRRKIDTSQQNITIQHF